MVLGRSQSPQKASGQRDNCRRPSRGEKRGTGGWAGRGTSLGDKTGTVQSAELNWPGEARDPDAWKKACEAV